MHLRPSVFGCCKRIFLVAVHSCSKLRAHAARNIVGVVAGLGQAQSAASAQKSEKRIKVSSFERVPKFRISHFKVNFKRRGSHTQPQLLAITAGTWHCLVLVLVATALFLLFLFFEFQREKVALRIYTR